MLIVRGIKVLLWLVVCSGLGAAAFFTFSWHKDIRIIEEALAGRYTAKPGTGQFVKEVNAWVFKNQGFRKNPDYYLFPPLGPTPLQVLEKGGDCSDKSRLLATILRRFGSDATLVMLYECADCEATHTVVEASYDQGRMAADPVFDLVFPDGDGGWFDVSALRADPAILPQRLDAESRARGAWIRYKRNRETYSWPRTINWKKYPALEAVANTLAALGIDPYLVYRPAFLDDPKRLLAYASLGTSGLAGSGLLLLHYRYPRRRTNPDAGSAPVV